MRHRQRFLESQQAIQVTYMMPVYDGMITDSLNFRKLRF